MRLMLFALIAGSALGAVAGIAVAFLMPQAAPDIAGPVGAVIGTLLALGSVAMKKPKAH